MRTLFLVLLLPLASSYQTSCFNDCACDANSINCTNVHQDNLDWLSHISVVNFPQLNYLQITRARFGDLKGQIFRDTVHANLHTINLTNAGITSFTKWFFYGAPNLRALHLDSNPLRTADEKALSELHDLEVLTLNRIFDADRTNNEQILRRLFDSPLDSLKEVSLRGNELRLLDIGRLFCNFSSLRILDLSGNRLESFSFPPDCKLTLDKLVLSDNDLTELPTLSNVQVKELIVDNNPLDCEFDFCDARELLDTVDNKISITCASPHSSRGVSLAEMLEKADCQSQGSTHNVLIGMGIVLVATLLVVWWTTCYRSSPSRKIVQYDMVQLADEESGNPTFL